MNTTSNEKSYFDLHTSGIGYLQRVREVPVRGGRRAQPFLACTIAALVGPARDPSYRYFDVKVSGAEAKKLVQRYIGVDDPKQRPLVRFRLGDLWGDVYIRDKGEQKGQAAASMRRELAMVAGEHLAPRDRGDLAEVIGTQRDVERDIDLAPRGWSGGAYWTGEWSLGERWLSWGTEVMKVDHDFVVSIYTRDPNGNSVEWCADARAYTEQDRIQALRDLEDRAPKVGPSYPLKGFWKPERYHPSAVRLSEPDAAQ